MNASMEKAPLDRAKIGRNAGIVGIAVNLLLFGFKLLAGLLSGSVSIIADAINNLTDAGSSILVMVGYIISSKPADKEHPYGHARMEYICSLFISIIVTVLGVELLKSAIDSFKAALAGGEAAQFDTLSLVIMGAAIVVKILLALFYTGVGKKIQSDSLHASAIDSIGDVCATAAVILGILLTPVIGPIADGIFGGIIAIYILIMGIKLIKESADTLLGTPPDVDLIKKIVHRVKSYDGVLGIHDLVVHNYGVDQLFATLHVEVDADRDVMESHDTIDNIEEDFRKELGIHLVIHLDPVSIHDERTNQIHASVHEILDNIAAAYSSPISMHDFRAVFGVTHTNLIFDVAISNDFPLSNEEVVKAITDDVTEKLGKEYCLVLTIDREYVTTRY